MSVPTRLHDGAAVYYREDPLLYGRMTIVRKAGVNMWLCRVADSDSPTNELFMHRELITHAEFDKLELEAS